MRWWLAICLLALGLMVGCSKSEDKAKKYAAKCLDDSAEPDNEICEKACDAGDGESCKELFLQLMLHGPELVPDGPNQTTFQEPHYQRAYAILEKGCKTGYLECCGMLAGAQSKGIGTPTNKMLALKTHRKACEKGYQPCCTQLGVELVFGDVPNLDRGLELLRSSCDAGEGEGCAYLATVYEQGKWVKKDIAKGRALLQKGCDASEKVCCLRLGKIYLDLSDTGVRDVERGLKLLEKGCELRSQDSCVALIVTYGGKFPFVAKDEAKSFHYAEKSCALHEDGCFILALYHHRGLGTPKDPEKTRAILNKYCHAGHQQFCDEKQRLGL